MIGEASAQAAGSAEKRNERESSSVAVSGRLEVPPSAPEAESRISVSRRAPASSDRPSGTRGECHLATPAPPAAPSEQGWVPWRRGLRRPSGCGDHAGRSTRGAPRRDGGVLRQRRAGRVLGAVHPAHQERSRAEHELARRRPARHGRGRRRGHARRRCHGRALRRTRASWRSAVGVSYIALPFTLLAPSALALAGVLAVMGAASGVTDVAMNANGAAVEHRYGAADPLVAARALERRRIRRRGHHRARDRARRAGRAAPRRGGGRLRPARPRGLHAAHARGRATPAIAPPRRSRPTRLVLGLALISLAAFLAEGAINDWGPLYLRTSLDESATVAAAGYAVFVGSMAIMRLTGDRLTSRAGRVPVVRFGALLAGIALAARAATRAARGDVHRVRAHRARAGQHLPARRQRGRAHALARAGDRDRQHGRLRGRPDRSAGDRIRRRSLLAADRARPRRRALRAHRGARRTRPRRSRNRRGIPQPGYPHQVPTRGDVDYLLGNGSDLRRAGTVDCRSEGTPWPATHSYSQSPHSHSAPSSPMPVPRR